MVTIVTIVTSNYMGLKVRKYNEFRFKTEMLYLNDNLTKGFEIPGMSRGSELTSREMLPCIGRTRASRKLDKYNLDARGTEYFNSVLVP